MKRTLNRVLRDFSILSGDVVGESGDTWQEVARRCADDLRALADQVEKARRGGSSTTFATFPSPHEAFDAID